MLVEALKQKGQPLAALLHCTPDGLATYVTLLAAQLAYRSQLRRQGRHFGFDLRNFELAACVLA